MKHRRLLEVQVCSDSTFFYSQNSKLPNGSEGNIELFGKVKKITNLGKQTAVSIVICGTRLKCRVPLILCRWIRGSAGTAGGEAAVPREPGARAEDVAGAQARVVRAVRVAAERRRVRDVERPPGGLAPHQPLLRPEHLPGAFCLRFSRNWWH
jgi:hypothetical protein